MPAVLSNDGLAVGQGRCLPAAKPNPAILPANVVYRVLSLLVPQLRLQTSAVAVPTRDPLDRQAAIPTRLCIWQLCITELNYALLADAQQEQEQQHCRARAALRDPAAATCALGVHASASLLGPLALKPCWQAQLVSPTSLLFAMRRHDWAHRGAVALLRQLHVEFAGSGAVFAAPCCLSQLTALQRLHVWGKQQGGALRFPAWVTSLRELRHLSLGHLAPAQDRQGVGRQQHQHQHQRCQDQELSAAAASLSTLQHLTVLKLGYSTMMTEDPLQEGLPHLPRLRRLYLSGAAELASWELSRHDSPAGMSLLSLRRLHALSVRGCRLEATPGSLLVLAGQQRLVVREWLPTRIDLVEV